MLKHFAALWLRLAGWTVDKRLPDENKYVLIVAYHTSNWDFIYGILAMWAMGERFFWVGKHTLFWGPFAYIFRFLGGIPVDRRAHHGFIARMVEQFNKHDVMKLTIVPEGTRSRVSYWKTGFYYIAMEAKVPIAFGYLDYKNKKVGVGKTFYPSGDIDKDMDAIRKFYQDKSGKCPEKQGDIRLKSN
ncbi:MAG: lysophospholipid acyltransferase family protein [Gammaproteobacteria bacterium]|nr:lysophospholipid acyltransferase family protein [Gammaproteobacteria bacterium]